MNFRDSSDQSLASAAKSRVLLCPPDHYGIEYEINPWMDRTHGADRGLARKQWEGLRALLIALGCTVDLVEPQLGFPDLVFTANAGLVIGRQFIESRFRYPERQGEEVLFDTWFRQQGYEVVRLPESLIFEGEGDALFAGETLFCGYHFRSDIQSHRWLGEVLDCLVVSLELIDQRFYHLDTCFCPLSESCAVWYPAAFDDYARRAIRGHFDALIEVSLQESLLFACNAVVVGHDVVLPEGCATLCASLERVGYRCHGLPMSEFIKAGGACKCLTLFLPQREKLQSGLRSPPPSPVWAM